MNKKGFTLIEILAVIIILGVIMTIAIPNVLSMIERNKKDTFIEHAKMMATQAEYTIRKDVNIEYPSENKAIILTLEYLNTSDISESPYGTTYNKERSFVAIVNEKVEGFTEYKYYVHLITCGDDECTDVNAKKNRGINLIDIDELTGSVRFSKVVTAGDVKTDYLNIADDSATASNKLLDELTLKEINGVEKIYNKLP